MSLVIDLPTELETELSSAAARVGLPLPEYILRLLSSKRAADSASLRNGAELLAYWHNEGLVGSRPEVVDSAAHARELREQAQTRVRS